MKNVFLTYNNEKLQDGVFAQIQRQLAIYSISKSLHFRFIYSPIIDLIVTQLDNFQNESEIKKFINKINNNFRLPSSSNFEDFDRVIDIEIPSVFYLFRVKFKYFTSNKKILVRITNPYKIMENYPISYKPSVEAFKKLKKINDLEGNFIVAHIRRGISLDHVSPGEGISRMLNEEYYLEVLNKISTETSSFLKLIILTDAPESDFLYEPINKDYSKWNQYEAYKRGRKVLIQGHKFALINEMYKGEVVVIRGGDLLQAFNFMKNAKFLIMSRSSMSYVGAVLNDKGRIFYPPNFWHKSQKNWIKSS